MDMTQSLADAIRTRARYLLEHTTHLEYKFGDTRNVVALLFELADLMDSWSGEYLSKEETYNENERRRWLTQPTQKSMTMEERRNAVKKIDISKEL